MFVGGLKALAPLLVFALVANAPSQTQKVNSNEDSYCSLSLWDFAAAFFDLGSYFSLYFPISLKLGAATATKATAPPRCGRSL